jgi:hypothetical protein
MIVFFNEKPVRTVSIPYEIPLTRSMPDSFAFQGRQNLYFMHNLWNGHLMPDIRFVAVGYLCHCFD